MSWTDSNTVRAHLPLLERRSTAVRDAQIAFSDEGKALLSHRSIEATSLIVKRALKGSPTGPEAITLSGEGWSILAHSNVVPGELVVATNRFCDTVYDRETDFVLDSAEGKIRRLSGSSIGDGASVSVYYQRYEVFALETDYLFDSTIGEIKAVSGGGIEAGSSLVVDYDLTPSSGVEGLIDLAITEAENKIANVLGNGYGSSTIDQRLTTGATELTLSILCRQLAAQALSDGMPSASQRGKVWLLMADGYESQAMATLRAFLGVPSLVSPHRQGNTSWKWE